MTPMQHIQVSYRKLWQLLTYSSLVRVNKWKEIPKTDLMVKSQKKITLEINFFKSRLLADTELSKKTKSKTPLNWLEEKSSIFWKKRSQSFFNPKELWEPLKHQSMPRKPLLSNLEDSDTLTYNTWPVLKNFFLNLAESLLTQLPNPQWEKKNPL